MGLDLEDQMRSSSQFEWDGSQFARIAIWGAGACGALWLMPWDGGPLAWMPSESEVERSFAAKHEAWEVVSVDAISGDNDGSIYQIRFREEGDDEIRIAEWSVHSSGEWFGWELDGERFVTTTGEERL